MMDDVIGRAAAYTQEDVEALTVKRPQHLSLPLCELLQRSPAARYQSAGALAAELHGWLGEHFGKSEAHRPARLRFPPPPRAEDTAIP
jgi:hypothetical protein